MQEEEGGGGRGGGSYAEEDEGKFKQRKRKRIKGREVKKKEVWRFIDMEKTTNKTHEEREKVKEGELEAEEKEVRRRGVERGGKLKRGS